VSEDNVGLVRNGFDPLARHEFTAIGDKVLVDFTLHARGRTTGIAAEQRAFQVWTLRGEKALRLEVCVERDQVIAAARA
jgi:hypothetical protein